MSKTFLTVLAQHNTDGKVTPLKLIWPDNRQFTIDRVVDVRMAAALKTGGCGIRYRCMVHGKQIDLFNEEGHWYIDK